MTWPHLIEPADLLGPDAVPEALETTARAHNIARILGVPLVRRGELMEFLATVDALEPTTPHLSGLWRWRDVIRAMKKRAPDFIPDQFRKAAAEP